MPLHRHTHGLNGSGWDGGCDSRKEENESYKDAQAINKCHNSCAQSFMLGGLKV